MIRNFHARILARACAFALGLYCAQPGVADEYIPIGLENATKSERVRYAADLDRKQREKEDRQRQIRRKQILEALPAYAEQGKTVQPEPGPPAPPLAAADNLASDLGESEDSSAIPSLCLAVLLVAAGCHPRVRERARGLIGRWARSRSPTLASARLRHRANPARANTHGPSLGATGDISELDSPEIAAFFAASCRPGVALLSKADNALPSAQATAAGNRPNPLKPAPAASLPSPTKQEKEPAKSVPPSSALSKSLCADGRLDPETMSKLAHEFFLRAPGYVDALEETLFQILESTEEEVRLALMGDLYLRIHSLTCTAERIGLRPAHKLGSTVEALVKRLFEDPKAVNNSTLGTASSAIEVLKSVCVPGLRQTLAEDPPVRMLVVDDDLLSRRAMACALQMAFDKPDSAAGGQAALAMAAGHPYDVIFLDVNMPDMDGFTVCANVHETEANRQTPVVFVTSQSDQASRAQAISGGGSDLVAKPFLLIELTLKALTFALQDRLQKLQVTSDLAHN